MSPPTASCPLFMSREISQGQLVFILLWRLWFVVQQPLVILHSQQEIQLHDGWSQDKPLQNCRGIFNNIFNLIWYTFRNEYVRQCSKVNDFSAECGRPLLQCPARVDIGSSRSEKWNENLVHSFREVKSEMKISFTHFENEKWNENALRSRSRMKSEMKIP